MEQKGTLKYRKIQRTPQSGENAGKKKWYATSVTDREVDFRRLRYTHRRPRLAIQPRHHPRCTDGCSRPLAGVDSRRQERPPLRSRPLLHRHEFKSGRHPRQGNRCQRRGRSPDCTQHQNLEQLRAQKEVQD